MPIAMEPLRTFLRQKREWCWEHTHLACLYARGNGPAGTMPALPGPVSLLTNETSGRRATIKISCLQHERQGAFKWIISRRSVLRIEGLA